jgi:hypothetical protein
VAMIVYALTLIGVAFIVAIVFLVRKVIKALAYTSLRGDLD